MTKQSLRPVNEINMFLYKRAITHICDFQKCTKDSDRIKEKGERGLNLLKQHSGKIQDERVFSQCVFRPGGSGLWAQCFKTF